MMHIEQQFEYFKKRNEKHTNYKTNVYMLYVACLSSVVRFIAKTDVRFIQLI